MQQCFMCGGGDTKEVEIYTFVGKSERWVLARFPVCPSISPCLVAFRRWFYWKFDVERENPTKRCCACSRAVGQGRLILPYDIVHSSGILECNLCDDIHCEARFADLIQIGLRDCFAVPADIPEENHTWVYSSSVVEFLEKEKASPATTLGAGRGDKSVTVADEAREMGMYVLGVQGQGKSSFLESLIYQDIQKGYAVIVIDPHRDLLNNVIAELPSEVIDRVRFVDIEDVGFPFGVNLFTCEDINNPLVAVKSLDRVMHVFDRLFSGSERILLDKYLRNLSYVMLANAGVNFAHIPLILFDSEVRNKMLTKVKQVNVRNFWLNEYEAMTVTERRKETKSLMNRVNKIITNPMLEKILTAPETSIDFRRAIENKEIVLINLPLREYGQTASDCGTVLLAEIYRAVFSFADTARSSRPGFSLYVDEFQNFVTDDFAVLFKEGRKYGCKVTIAHQDRADLEGKNKTATLTANTFVTFQPTNTDANEIASLFIEQDTEIAPHAIYRDVHKHMPYHHEALVRDFWDYWIKFLELDKNDDKEVSQSLIFELDDMLYQAQLGSRFDDTAIDAYVRKLNRYRPLSDYGKTKFNTDFRLRASYLFYHPIADRSSATKIDAGSALRALQKRCALVRIGGKVSSFKTADTPDRIADITDRKKAIVENTRASYAVKASNEKAQQIDTDINTASDTNDDIDEDWKGWE